ncbi:MAG: hypothetical protein OEV93_01935 [Candidatus Moranbacteria bacterium]|nr:hypothetical protein [Candidatus Moranbacteria bacterium]
MANKKSGKIKKSKVRNLILSEKQKEIIIKTLKADGTVRFVQRGIHWKCEPLPLFGALTESQMYNIAKQVEKLHQALDSPKKKKVKGHQSDLCAVIGRIKSLEEPANVSMHYPKPNLYPIRDKNLPRAIRDNYGDPLCPNCNYSYVIPLYTILLDDITNVICPVCQKKFAFR